jgi:hypothetical protein
MVLPHKAKQMTSTAHAMATVALGIPMAVALRALQEFKVYRLSFEKMA